MIKYPLFDYNAYIASRPNFGVGLWKLMPVITEIDRRQTVTIGCARKVDKMGKLNLNIDPRVEAVFARYPDAVRDKMLYLSDLVIETTRETDGLDELEQTLKWGEPSFVAKHGSTLRMDWKEKSPDQYAMYFKCTSSLVETFKLVFGRTFQYEGSRAIVFQLDQKIPERELKQCIRAALTYHKVKKINMLGIAMVEPTQH